MRFLTVVLFVFTVIFLCPNHPQVVAQDAIDHRITAWGGYSFNSIRFLGKTRNSQSRIFAIGYQRRLKNNSEQRAWWYTADIIPYIHFYYPKRDEDDRFVTRSGFGFSPVGFMLSQKTDFFLQPYLQSTGGFIYMEDEFPTDNARRLNFTFDVTLGANIPVNSFSSISLGYKFHHISNAETGTENPGLDSNFLFVTLFFH